MYKSTLIHSYFFPVAIAAAVLVGAMVFGPASASAAKPVFSPPSSDFTANPKDETTAAHFEAGGWLIHSIPFAGDLLYGCTGLDSAAPGCSLVVLPIRTPGTSIENVYTSPDTGAAWIMVTAPPLGDFLFACHDPGGDNPSCAHVRLKARPLGKLERFDAAADAAGGLVPGLPKLGAAPPASPAPGADQAERTDHPDSFWLKSSITLPGPVNLYACRGLDSQAKCELGVNAMDFIQGEKFGLRELSTEALSEDDSPLAPKGVMVGQISSGSAAAAAGLAEGNIITKAGGFSLFSALHLEGLMAQVASGKTIELTLKSGKSVKMTRIRSTGSW